MRTVTRLPPFSDSSFISRRHWMNFSTTVDESPTTDLLMRRFVPPESAMFSAALTIMSCGLWRIMCDVSGNLYRLLAMPGRKRGGIYAYT